MEYQFTIDLKPITKKNSQRVIRDGAGHTRIIPSAAYKRYEKECALFMPRVGPIETAVNVKAVYYMPNKRRVDLTNLHEALHDILVYYGVLADDNSRIIASTDGSRVDVDKRNPRTEVTITELTPPSKDLETG